MDARLNAPNDAAQPATPSSTADQTTAAQVPAEESHRNFWLIASGVVGGILLLPVLAILVVWLAFFAHRGSDGSMADAGTQSSSSTGNEGERTSSAVITQASSSKVDDNHNEKVEIGSDKLVFHLAENTPLVMKGIPAMGKTFWMGSPDQEGLDVKKTRRQGERDYTEQQHQVQFTHDYYLGEWTVTQAQYRAVIGKNPSHFCKGGKGANEIEGMDTDNFPVEMVSWNEAAHYCELLTKKFEDCGYMFRLPTEAEWEYACREGDSNKATMPFYLKGGPSASLSGGQVNFDGNPCGGGEKNAPLKRTSRSGEFPQAVNSLGLWDMHGNVWEWCEDYYSATYYRQSAPLDPICNEDQHKGIRVLRGGSWLSGCSACRAAYRYREYSDARYWDIGFRVCAVRTAKPRVVSVAELHTALHGTFTTSADKGGGLSITFAYPNYMLNPSKDTVWAAGNKGTWEIYTDHASLTPTDKANGLVVLELRAPDDPKTPLPALVAILTEKDGSISQLTFQTFLGVQFPPDKQMVLKRTAEASTSDSRDTARSSKNGPKEPFLSIDKVPEDWTEVEPVVSSLDKTTVLGMKGKIGHNSFVITYSLNRDLPLPKKDQVELCVIDRKSYIKTNYAAKDLGDDVFAVTVGGAKAFAKVSGIIIDGTPGDIMLFGDSVEDVVKTFEKLKGAKLPPGTDDAAPKDAKGLLKRGAAFHTQKDYDRAIADFTEAIRIASKTDDAACYLAYVARAQAYIDKKDNDQAMSDYKAAIVLAPKVESAYKKRGALYSEMKDYDNAIADYTEALRINPKDDDTYNSRGNAYSAKQDDEHAILDYTEAIRLYPNHATAHCNRGICYYGRKDYKKAISDYDEAIRLNPKFAMAYFLRGIAHEANGNPVQSQADIKKAKELDPDLAK